ncbi:uncharacterized protein LOC108342746 [Vigna angularis]|uniref:uncharacterized protein LOC108342746 n=1 Tax=Phaseolus angularis TaxID=3914 RepID=UPI0022B53CF3|nr:uncharacterized protein LOC108342746 [Vigna angularis]
MGFYVAVGGDLGMGWVVCYISCRFDVVHGGQRLNCMGYFKNFRLKCFQREKVENISRSTEPSNLRASHHNSRRISAARRRCRCRFRSIQCHRCPSSSTQPGSSDCGSPQLRRRQTNRRRHRLPSGLANQGRILSIDSSHPLPSLCRTLAVAAGVSSKCRQTLSRRLEMNKLSEDVSSFVNCLSLSLIFIGNPGLCGYWLDSSCQGSHPTERGERRSNAREYKQQKNLVANRKMLLSRTNNSQI